MGVDLYVTQAIQTQSQCIFNFQLNKKKKSQSILNATIFGATKKCLHLLIFFFFLKTLIIKRLEYLSDMTRMNPSEFIP